VIGRHLDEPGLADACSRGYRYWVDRCFDPDGAPRYTNTSRWPVDPHVSAQAILTFKTFADQDGEAMRRAWRIATWTIDHFQDPRGFFHYQQHRFYRVRIPFMRWTQAWMQVALTELLADGARP
jgi:hypothetical protein